MPKKMLGKTIESGHYPFSTTKKAKSKAAKSSAKKMGMTGRKRTRSY